MVYSIHPANINNGKLKILIKLVYVWVQNVILYLMLQNLSLKPFGTFRIRGKNFWNLEFDIMHVWTRREFRTNSYFISYASSYLIEYLSVIY